MRRGDVVEAVIASMTAQHVTLGDLLAALSDRLLVHLQHEERDPVPLLTAHLTAADIDSVGKAHRRESGLRGAKRFLPWVLEGASPLDRDHVLGQMPPPLTRRRSSSNRHEIAAGSSQTASTLDGMTRAGTADDGVSVELVRAGPEDLRIVVAGVLSTPGASTLQAVLLEALMTRPVRIHLDLTRLTYASPVGIAALATCLSLGRQLRDGVGVSVAGPAGRRALLRSLADH